MPILYILCGVPGSGKSTWANTFNYNDTRYVSRDEIRFNLVKNEEEYFSHEKEVFNKFVGTITQTLVDGFSVIADATHLNMASRRKLTYNIDKTFSDYKIVYVIFETDLDTCLTRNAARAGRANVPEDVIKSMYNSFRAPRPDEDKRMIGTITIKGNII